MTIGTKIKICRKELNLTQNDLAKKLFVSREAIAKWECDNGTPSVENILAIGKTFNVSLDNLLKDEVILTEQSIKLNNLKIGGNNVINYDSINIFLLKYDKRFGEIAPVLQDAADTYYSDFSVLLKQDYIDLLSEFVEFQIEIQDLMELAVLKNDDINLNLKLRKILLDLKSFSFHELYLKYFNSVNEFIEKIKLPENNSFKKQLALSTSVIDIWQEYMEIINYFNSIILSFKEES